MIKPSSGGFDMHKWADSKKIIKGLEKNLEDEMYLTRQLDKARDTLVERIKELEDELTTFIDETNRLTAINKELEQKQMKLNGQCIEYIRKIDKLEQENLRLLEIEEIKAYEIFKLRKELDRYWLLINAIKLHGYEGNITEGLIKEFEEAKE